MSNNINLYDIIKDAEKSIENKFRDMIDNMHSVEVQRMARFKNGEKTGSNWSIVKQEGYLSAIEVIKKEINYIL